MTSALQLTTRALDPAVELSACLDRVAALDVDILDAAGQAALLQAVTSAEARLSAVRLRVLAAAERSHAAAGAISAEHAAAIVRTDRHLPGRLTPAERDTVESALLSKARVLSPGGLRRAARRALETVEADAAVVDAHENATIAAAEERARARTRLSLHDNADGTVTGHFTVPTAQGHLLRKVLQTMTAPRRARLGAGEAQIGPVESRMDGDRVRGEAFCELIEHLPTDHLHPRTAATLVVTIGEDALRASLRVAGLDTGEVISAGEARRLACGAGIIPAVLGGASLPLDLGRASRLFSDSQRRALGIRHQTCAADGCERPFAWCELHHRQAWARGGRTDLADAVPLCHFHHRRIHDDSYRHRLGRDGSVSFHRRT